MKIWKNAEEEKYTDNKLTKQSLYEQMIHLMCMNRGNKTHVTYYRNNFNTSRFIHTLAHTSPLKTKIHFIMHGWKGAPHNKSYHITSHHGTVDGILDFMDFGYCMSGVYCTDLDNNAFSWVGVYQLRLCSYYCYCYFDCDCCSVLKDLLLFTLFRMRG